MDIDDYKRIINNFSFDRCKRGNQGFNRVLIQLFGLLGHGKSSFINTCKYVWEDGEYRNWAKAYGSDGGLTTERITYKLTGNITLVDNRGYKTLDSYETGEIFAQLGNLLPLGKDVDWSKGFALVDRIVKAEKEIKTSDFIIPVFVHSVKRIIPSDEIDELKNLIETAKKLTEVYPIVVLTHKTSGNLTNTEATFRNMGVERIFSFENYTTEDHFKTRGRHEEVLKFLHEVIKDVQFRVEQPRDPVREMKDRRQFVMNYVHNREKSIQMENIERQKAMERALLEKKLEQEKKALEEKAMREKRLWDEELQRQREEFNRRRAVDQARFDAEENAAQMPKPDKPKKILGIFKKKNKH
ncbi:uncharacterized protein LOC142098320 [Mixophyes fleayi]|uniref:uncharacterized protein LOC142098320 n=1 Tax=Mixophyes fleayi TaxID=3061075 RepID=UPI003F4E0DE7